MWLFTSFGFFSVVQKEGDTDLTVRGRVAADLDRLRERYLPELGPTTDKGGTDYPSRARVSHEAFARAVAQIARDVDFANFKDEVGKELGHERAEVYHQVWSALRKLERA